MHRYIRADLPAPEGPMIRTLSTGSESSDIILGIFKQSADLLSLERG